MARRARPIDPAFTAATRHNWGYWDGVSARERGRYPEWAKSSIYRQTHPTDPNYGVGFWKGWEGETPEQALRYR